MPSGRPRTKSRASAAVLKTRFWPRSSISTCTPGLSISRGSMIRSIASSVSAAVRQMQRVADGRAPPRADDQRDLAREHVVLGVGRRAEDAVVGRRDARLAHQLLGEDLAPLELGGFLPRAEDPQALALEDVDDPLDAAAPRGRRPSGRSPPAWRTGPARGSRPARSTTFCTSSAVPALPGAQTTAVTRGDCFSFQHRACSRPPLPTTRTFNAPTPGTAPDPFRLHDNLSGGRSVRTGPTSSSLPGVGNFLGPLVRWRSWRPEVRPFFRMRNIKLLLSYDGTDFSGWQRQPDRRTVQQVLEEALGRLTGCVPPTNASGRTDAGVHALGQVVHFYTASRHPPEVFVKALNAMLPHDVRVRRRLRDAPGVSRDARRQGQALPLRDRQPPDRRPVPDPLQRPRLPAARRRRDEPRRAGAQGDGTTSTASRPNWPNRTSSVRTITHIAVNSDERLRLDRGRGRRLPV